MMSLYFRAGEGITEVEIPMKSERELWRGPPEEFGRTSPKITESTLDHALEKARPHPISCEIPILERYEPYLPDPERFSDGAFRRYARLLTDDDPQVPSLVFAAIRRRCFDLEFRPGTHLAKLIEHFRDPCFANSGVVQVWNTVVRRQWCKRDGDVPSFDVSPFEDHIARLKAVAG